MRRLLTLRLLDERDAHVDAQLKDDWFDTAVDVGDTIHLIFTRHEASSSSHVAYDPQPHAPSQITVDNDQNIVIVHPDFLVRKFGFP